MGADVTVAVRVAVAGAVAVSATVGWDVLVGVGVGVGVRVGVGVDVAVRVKTGLDCPAVGRATLALGDRLDRLLTADESAPEPEPEQAARTIGATTTATTTVTDLRLLTVSSCPTSPVLRDSGDLVRPGIRADSGPGTLASVGGGHAPTSMALVGCLLIRRAG